MADNNNVPEHMVIADSLLARIKALRVSLILVALGFAPLLGLFFVMSWDRPAYQFFPLALAGAALLAWRALTSVAASRESAADSPLASPKPSVGGHPSPAAPQPSVGGPRSSPLPSPAVRSQSSVVRGPVVLGAASVLLFLLANGLWSPWLGYVAFLFGLTSLFWRLGGKALVLACAPALLILLTILPPPLNGDVTLTVWLRTVAVHTSSVLLDWLQVTHAQDGNTLLLPGKTLLVEEACSGINSFILCNFLCLFWGLWRRRSPLWFLFALPATSLFVVQGNIFRITAGAAAFYFRHWDLLGGRPHEIFGLVLLIGYCVLILSFDQCLVFLTSGRRSQPAVAAPRESAAASALAAPKPSAGGPTAAINSPPLSSPSHSSFVIRHSSLASPLLALLGLGVFAAHLFLGGHHGLAKLPSLSSVRELNLSLPASVAGWQRINSNSGDPSWAQTYGFRSANWQFQHNGVTATVAADYPLDGFHNVKGCYLGNGWQVLAEKELLLPPAGEDSHAIKLELQKSLQYAVVLHSVINGQGQWLSAPLNVTSRFADTVAAPQKGYRVQMITVGYGPLSPAVEADCQSLFLQARQLLVRQLVEQLQTTSAK